MKRVLILVPTLDFDHGTVTQLGILLGNLPAGAADVSVGVLGPRSAKSAPWADRYRVRFLGQRWSPGLTSFRELRRWRRDEAFDVTHAFGEAALRMSTGKVLFSPFPTLPASLPGRTLDRVFRKTPERELRLPPAVEPPSGLAKREEFLGELGLPGDARLIMAASRMEKFDRLLPAVRTFDYLRIVYPELHFVFFGDGPAQGRLRDWSYGLARGETRTIFPGARADVRDLLRFAEVVWESDPESNVTREATAAGRPVIWDEDTVTMARRTRKFIDEPTTWEPPSWESNVEALVETWLAAI